MATETRKYTLFHDPEAKGRGGGGGVLKLQSLEWLRWVKKLNKYTKILDSFIERSHPQRMRYASAGFYKKLSDLL